MPRVSAFVLGTLAWACGGGGGEDQAVTAEAGAGGAASEDAGAGGETADQGGLPPDVGTVDPGPLPSLRAVAGDLTFAERARPGDATTGHLYSIQTDAMLRQRLTATAAAWGHHAVGPDKRYIAVIRHRTAAGEDTDGAPGEVWIVDVKTHDEWVISPSDCDAGAGGVGWRDEVQVMFAAECEGEASTVYLAARDDRTRDRSHLLPVFTAEEPIREVFPAVATSVFAYTLDHEVCSGGQCFRKPQIWVADADSGDHCQVTDGDLGFDDVSTVVGGEPRLGDRWPAFSVDLTSLTFSRNVGGKPGGPEGHLDPFRVGVDLAALYGGRPTCAVGGSLTNLTDRLVEDHYDLPGGAAGAADEIVPQSATGGGELSGGLLYLARRAPWGVVFYADRMGNRVALSDPAGEAVSARWITDRFDTGGIR